MIFSTEICLGRDGGCGATWGGIRTAGDGIHATRRVFCHIRCADERGRRSAAVLTIVYETDNPDRICNWLPAAHSAIPAALFPWPAGTLFARQAVFRFPTLIFCFRHPNFVARQPFPGSRHRSLVSGSLFRTSGSPSFDSGSRFTKPAGLFFFRQLNSCFRPALLRFRQANSLFRHPNFPFCSMSSQCGRRFCHPAAHRQLIISFIGN